MVMLCSRPHGPGVPPGAPTWTPLDALGHILRCIGGASNVAAQTEGRIRRPAVRHDDGMHEHIKADSVAFAELGKAILEINQDVKSLLNSRSFLRGAWFALGISASVVVGAATLIITWFR